MLFKIIAIGIVTMVVSLVLKNQKPEIAMLASVCGGLLIFMIMIDGISSLVQEFGALENMAGVNINIVSPIMKVLGIGYITEFTASLAEDSGNKSIASKIVLGGKIAICVLAIPILKQLVQTILSLI